MNFKYCRAWSRQKKSPLDIIDSEVAKELHEKKENYTVIYGDISSPKGFAEILLKKGFIFVGHLDEFSREYISYQFKFLRDDDWFLVMAVHRNYVSSTDEIESGSTYFFNLKGEIFIRKEKFNPHVSEVANARFDPAGNYEKFLGFGDYGDFFKTER